MARLIAERGDVLPLLAEVFRAYGFEGASLARLTQGTGLGKGSLYHFFPGGKEEMAQAVLAEIDGWFRREVFAPLRASANPAQGVAQMFDATAAYFNAGRKVCVVGVFALGQERDRYTDKVQGYFAEWVDALAEALAQGGRDAEEARALSEDAVGAIQGALVLARAAGEPELFMRTLARWRTRLA